MSGEFKAGFDAGYNFTMKYFQNLRYVAAWPENWGNGIRGNGWVEGCISARGFIIDKQYPGWTDIMWMSDFKSYRITFKDGKVDYV